MKLLHIATTLGLGGLLAACGPNAETNAAAPANTAMADPSGSMAGMDNMSGDMGNMAMPAGAQMAMSSGTVTAIDKAAGKITLDHQAIPEVNWPAMTMTFDARPALLEGLAVGDKVAFDVNIAGSTGEVTAVTKQ